MIDIGITGIGSYLPKLTHTNETLPPLDSPLTTDEIHRIGVFARGWANDADESIAEMAAAAGRLALERAGLDAAELDVIILANWTQRRYIPEHSPRLQTLLGAKNAFAFDISGACTGFIYGLATAQGFLQNPRFNNALVVAAETTSKRARPGSKATLILGDGAGAFVLQKNPKQGGQLIDYELATVGEKHDIMDISSEGWVRTHIPQRELNHLAGHSMHNVAKALLNRHKLTVNDVDWVIPHSGTKGVQAVAAQALEVTENKMLTNYDAIGNISSASIPAALDYFLRAGVVKPGDLVLSTAVGTGWYAAAMLYRV